MPSFGTPAAGAGTPTPDSEGLFWDGSQVRSLQKKKLIKYLLGFMAADGSPPDSDLAAALASLEGMTGNYLAKPGGAAAVAGATTFATVAAFSTAVAAGYTARQATVAGAVWVRDDAMVDSYTDEKTTSTVTSAGLGYWWLANGTVKYRVLGPIVYSDATGLIVADVGNPVDMGPAIYSLLSSGYYKTFVFCEMYYIQYVFQAAHTVVDGFGAGTGYIMLPGVRYCGVGGGTQGFFGWQNTSDNLDFIIRNVEMDGNWQTCADWTGSDAAEGNFASTINISGVFEVGRIKVAGLQMNPNGSDTGVGTWENIYAHDFVRSPFLNNKGRVQGSNLHAKNSAIDHLFYGADGTASLINGFLQEGYCRGGYMVYSGQSMSSVSWQNLTPNPVTITNTTWSLNFKPTAGYLVDCRDDQSAAPALANCEITADIFAIEALGVPVLAQVRSDQAQILGWKFHHTGLGTGINLPFSLTSGAFVVGNTVTGATSGATGTITGVTSTSIDGLSGVLKFATITGTFQPGESLTSTGAVGAIAPYMYYSLASGAPVAGNTITGATSGASATILQVIPLPSTSAAASTTGLLRLGPITGGPFTASESLTSTGMTTGVSTGANAPGAHNVIGCAVMGTSGAPGAWQGGQFSNFVGRLLPEGFQPFVNDPWGYGGSFFGFEMSNIDLIYSPDATVQDMALVRFNGSKADDFILNGLVAQCTDFGAGGPCRLLTINLSTEMKGVGIANCRRRNATSVGSYEAVNVIGSLPGTLANNFIKSDVSLSLTPNVTATRAAFRWSECSWFDGFSETRGTQTFSGDGSTVLFHIDTANGLPGKIAGTPIYGHAWLGNGAGNTAISKQAVVKFAASGTPGRGGIDVTLASAPASGTNNVTLGFELRLSP